MSVSGITQNFYQYRQPAANQSVKGNKEEDFHSKITTVSSRTTNQVMLDPDALFSICDASTGESANVYHAEGFSKDNPVYLVKGIGKDGREYEEIIDVSKVNPNHCSYREMLALNTHTGNKSDSNFLTMAVLKDKAGNASYEDKVDYLSIAYGILKEMKMAGCWDGYIRYDKWIQDIQNVSRNSNLTAWQKGMPVYANTNTDPKYTDKETGISWHVRNGREPYMTSEEAEKLRELCKKTGEPWLKKFAEMTGTIRHLNNDSVAYIGDNGTLIVSKDGRSLSVDMSSLTYDEIRNLFRNLSGNGDYFSSGFWAENIRKVKG